MESKRRNNYAVMCTLHLCSIIIIILFFGRSCCVLGCFVICTVIMKNPFIQLNTNHVKYRIIWKRRCIGMYSHAISYEHVTKLGLHYGVVL